MTINTIQKIIKIGSSVGVTIPAKAIEHYRLKPGDLVQVTIIPAEKGELGRIIIEPAKQ